MFNIDRKLDMKLNCVVFRVIGPKCAGESGDECSEILVLFYRLPLVEANLGNIKLGETNARQHEENRTDNKSEVSQINSYWRKVHQSLSPLGQCDGFEQP